MTFMFIIINMLERGKVVETQLLDHLQRNSHFDMFQVLRANHITKTALAKVTNDVLIATNHFPFVHHSLRKHEKHFHCYADRETKGDRVVNEAPVLS